MSRVDPDHLSQCWVHSHEEDAPGTIVFRPRGWSFPPSRGRRSIALKPDGMIEGASAGPDDRSQTTAGHWQLLPGNILEIATDGKSASHLELLDVSSDRMVVRK